MNKRLRILTVILLLCTATFLWARWERWTVTTVGNGSTELVAARAGMVPVIYAMWFSCQNAHRQYYAGTLAASPDKFMGDMYYNGRGGLIFTEEDKIDIVGDVGEAINVWTSADPGCDFNYKYRYVTNES